MLVKKFEEQAAAQPHKIAVHSVTGTLTYAELNSSADRAAHLIREKTLNRESQCTVGLLFSHDPRMIIAILAVLKTGNIYVPLSADFPHSRLSYMAADAEAALLLTDSVNEDTTAEVAAENNIAYINIDTIAKTAVPAENPPREALTGKLAYILYTSGSTGRPKGVRQTHENALYYVNNWIRLFSITAADQMTMFSSFCHDGSVQDIFSALHSGASLHVVDVRESRFALDIAKFVIDEKITLWHSVPSLYNFFVNTLTGAEDFPYLRFISLGGEALRKYDIQAFQQYFPFSRLVNVYGQTESSVSSTWMINPDDAVDKMIIGKPLDKTEIILIDEAGKKVDPLEKGEIIIACPHLSPGYWKDEETTKKTFRRHPELGILYRTGDLGRLLLDGSIEFIGRKDNQVKIRGFRVELGEIENRLLKHAGIEEAVVTAVEDSMSSGGRDVFLCAYIVCRQKVDPLELKAYLAGFLPAYMIPVTFTEMERFPLTGSGKVDRRALPAPEIPTGSEYAAPRSPLEEKLAAIWAQVLGGKAAAVGIDDDFFIRGHSLNAVSLTSRIHRLLNVKVPLQELFRRPTIRRLAAYIKGAEEDRFAAIAAAEKREYYPLSAAQQRFYMLQQISPRSTALNTPHVLKLEDGVNKEKLEEAFRQLIYRHESLRTSFVPAAGIPVQVIHAPGDIEFHIEFYNAGTIQNIAERFIRPFDLARGPLLRVGLIKTRPGENGSAAQGAAADILMVDFHHIISDGSSMQILIRDFDSLYKGEELPELRLQYRDFSLWQNHLAASGEWQEHERYWLQKLSGKLPVLRLPTDFPRPGEPSLEGDTFDFTLNKELTRELNRLRRQTGTTLYMVLLAALNVLLSRYTGQTDIIIGSPSAGRNHADLEIIIGLLIGSLMMRSFPQKDKTFAEFLQEVKQTTLEAYEHQVYPFEELLKKIDFEVEPGRSPAADIALIVHNMAEFQGSLDGDADSDLYVHKTSKLDFTLNAIEVGETILFKLEYCTRLFKRSTIQRMAEHFVNILKAAAQNPGVFIPEIDLFTAAEKKAVIGSTAAIYPLTHAQKRIYYTERLFPGRSCNTLAFIVRFNRELEKKPWQQAINILLQNNDGLRLRVVEFETDREPWQYIAPYRRYDPGSFDFSSASSAAFEEWKRSAAREPFSLIDSDLFYFAYLKFPGGGSGYCMKFFHLVSDGWTVDFLAKEIASIYEKLASGQEAVFSANPSYIGYIGEERQYLISDRLQEDRRFWHEYLSPLPPEARIWWNKGQPGDVKAAVKLLPLPGELRSSLHSYCKTHKTSLYKLFLSALAIYISRVSRLDDIVIGSAAHNRSKSRAKTAGMFVSTFPIRINVDFSLSFAAYVQEVGKQVNHIVKNHGQYPFDRLAAELKEKTGVDAGYLLNINLIGHPDIKEAGFGIEHIFPGAEPTLLAIHINPCNRDIQGLLELEWDYRQEIFSPREIEMMHRSVTHILAAALSRPEKKLAEIEICAAKEKEKILYTFNKAVPDRAAGRDKTLHRLFSQQAERTPHSTALTGTGLSKFRQISVTYRVLQRQAGQLALLLRERGLKPGDIAAIKLERSIEVITFTLAILEAGGAYLPIDPAFPAERQSYMLRDSRAEILLTDEDREAVSENGLPLIVVNSDPDVARIFRGQENPPPSPRAAAAKKSRAGLSSPPVKGNSLAYVLYTSGTSGQPKAVAVEHGNVVSYVAAFNREFRLAPKDVVLQQASYSFDVFVEETYPVLLSGGSLAVPAPDVIRDTRLLWAFIITRRITLISCSPLMLNELNRFEGFGIQPRHIPVHTFISGGDVLKKEHVDNFLPLSRVYNTYGPTEITVCASYYRCRAEDSAAPPIGSPILDYAVYILDKYDHLLPEAAAGELCIGGAGVTRGYLNNPELTAEKFVRLPFELDRSYRSNKSYKTYASSPLTLYRTGDLARWLPDGNIEFLGRIDRQIKIRGYRIESAEIENRFLEHEAVNEAVVLCRETTAGEKQLYAYIAVDNKKQAPGSGEIREYLSARLPAYMVPAFFVFVDKIPLTPQGKVDRRALLAYKEPHTRFSPAPVLPAAGSESTLAEVWKKVLQLDNIGSHDNFFEIGGTSITILQVQRELEKTLKKDIPVVKLFSYPTISSLARCLDNEAEGEEDYPGGETQLPGKNFSAPLEQTAGKQAAVIGISGVFPGAGDIRRFWENLKQGVESITFFSNEELEEVGISPDLFKNPAYVKARGIAAGAEYFDSSFFGYTPKEAEVMDPQMRVFHQCVWAALEDAGYNPFSYEKRIGLYAGSSPNLNWENVVTFFGAINTLSEFQARLLRGKDFMCTRISYKLNLKGPSFSLQTACSTSLTAVHLAVQGLLNGECEMALAGGVNIPYPQKSGYTYQEGMINSPDGHCRAFDADSAGVVGGNGAGVVVLKRYEEAAADGDNIYAVIKGSAINNDGIRKVGYTAPSVQGQAAVIRAAQVRAGIKPETITYIEAHGTGTELGDPVEIEALKIAFNSAKRGFCGIGSVKTNIGHLDAAAGIAGFIKAVLALKHRKLPPNLHFKAPNPKLRLEGSPFYVVAEPTEWKLDPLSAAHGVGRRAGVSSFGIGGTNAHVVLEEWDDANYKLQNTNNKQITNSKLQASNSDPQPPLLSADAHTSDMSYSSDTFPSSHRLLLLSAQTQPALDKMNENLAEFLKENPAVNLTDTAYTLQVGRRSMPFRRTELCASVEEAIEKLSGPGKKTQSFFVKEENPPVFFVFTGIGSQYVNMGLDLYRGEPLFREEMERCFEILKNLGLDLKEVLYPLQEVEKESEDLINQARFIQPLLFIFQYALAKFLIALGIRPRAMIGYSLGEYTAACISGVFSLEDALKIVVERAKLIQGTAPGAMLSVPLPEEKIKPLLTGDISLAIVNGPSCVVAGPKAAVEAFEEKMKARRLICTGINNSFAVHSALMEPIRRELEAKLKETSLAGPRIPYISDVSGNWISAAQAADPVYWGEQMCASVRFSDGLSRLLKEENAVFIEIGPGRVLSNMILQHADKKEGQQFVSLVRHRQEKSADDYFFLRSIGQLWLYGAPVDWTQYYAREKRRRISLPTYPFAKRKYWLEAPRAAEPGKLHGMAAHMRKPLLSDWFYVPSWKRSRLPVSPVESPTSSTCLLFADNSGFGERLAGLLRQSGREVVFIEQGEGFGKQEGPPPAYTIDPRQYSHYEQVMRDLLSKGTVPTEIIHAWNISADPDESRSSGWQQIEKDQYPGFYSLLYLGNVLAAAGLQDKDIRMTLFAQRLFEVMGEKNLSPGKALLLGPLQGLPYQLPRLSIRCVDVGEDIHAACTGEEEIFSLLLKEVTAGQAGEMAAYRNRQRWLRIYDPQLLEEAVEAPGNFVKDGVYLISGEPGGTAFVLAKHLIEEVGAKVVLLCDPVYPVEGGMQQWLEKKGTGQEQMKLNKSFDQTFSKVWPPAGPPEAKRGKKGTGKKSGGAKLLVVEVDMSSADAMKKALEQAEKTFGPVKGVIHTVNRVDPAGPAVPGAPGAPAAGTANQPGPVSSLEELQAQYHRKIKELLALQEVLQDKELDFCLLLSSLLAVLGGPGLIRAAALDAFAHSLAYLQGGVAAAPWVCVNLELRRSGPPGERSGSGDDLIEEAFLSEADAVQAIRRVLADPGAGQIIVSPLDFQAGKGLWQQFVAAQVREAGSRQEEEKGRQEYAVEDYAAPRNDLEQGIVRIWQEFLGFEKIGIHDNFFHLNGDSLTATQLVSRLKEMYPVEIPLQDFFAEPTVAHLAEVIKKLLVERIKSLSPEAKKRLAKK